MEIRTLYGDSEFDEIIRYLDRQYSTHVYVCLAFSLINTPLIHPQLYLSLPFPPLSTATRTVPYGTRVSLWQSTVREHYITSQTARKQKQKQRKEKKSNNAHPALPPYGATTVEGHCDRNFDHANYANHELYSSTGNTCTFNLSHSTSTQSGAFGDPSQVTIIQYRMAAIQYDIHDTVSIQQSISSHPTHPTSSARSEQTMPDWTLKCILPAHPHDATPSHPIIPRSLPPKSHSLPKTLTSKEEGRKGGRKSSHIM